MISKVIFEIKSNIRAWSDQIIDFKAKGFIRILINIKDINCEVVVDGRNEKDNYDYLY